MNVEENSHNAKEPGRFEKMYTMLLDAIPSSVLMINQDMRIAAANRNFMDKSRRTIDNTISHSLDEVFPDLILKQINIVSQLRQVFATKQPSNGQRFTYRAPGVPISIYYYRLLPFIWQGRVESAILLMDDVTEQVRLSEEVHRVERHLASIFESVSDIIVSMDTQGLILAWNSAAEKISGYTADEVKGNSFPHYFPEEHLPEIKKALTDVEWGGKSKILNWELITKEQTRLNVSWVCSPMKDRNSKTVGMVAVGRDLTEYRKLEMELVQSHKMASLGVMAGGIAHEIRNPLAVSSSSAQFLLEDDITPEFRKECAANIHDGIKRASTIIENLLKFSHPSMKTTMEEKNLPEIIEEALLLVANQAKIKKTEIRFCPDGESIFISGVVSLLQQVFINLFLNAINAMPDGGILTIRVRKTNKDAEVCVSDTGLGISKNDYNKIFDPFYTTSPVGQGTGLGLAVTYAILKQHSGSIEVNSVEGKGSDFIVRLPVY